MQIDHDPVQDFLPFEKKSEEVDEHLRLVNALNAITLKLQSNCTSMIDERNMYDRLARKYPSLKNRLYFSVKCSGNETSAYSITKMQNEKVEPISPSDQRTVRDLPSDEPQAVSNVQECPKTRLSSGHLIF